MADKLSIEEVQIGGIHETTFLTNPITDSEYRYRANHLDGRRAPKVVLSDDARIRPGAPCLVKITAIKKPNRKDRGSIEVEFVRLVEFELPGVYLDPAIARKLQILLESGLNILLDGPQGCGKTVLARSIADSLGMKFVLFNCGAVVEATDFLATIQIRSSDTGQPFTDFIRTEILIALEEATDNPRQRYLIFLDELNRCQESARNVLMPALDSTRQIFHPIENRFLPIADNVQFIAAVNRGNEFSATFGIDAAQLDRFAPLQMDYLPPKDEIDLLTTRHPEVSKKTIEILVSVASELREATTLGSGLSVRATEEACIYLKHPLMNTQQPKVLADVLRSSFCGRYPGRWTDMSSDAGAAWALIKNTLRSARIPLPTESS